MNGRHAAALALLGWYLMLPPIQGSRESGYRVDDGAPFSQWQLESGLEMAAECNAGLSRFLDWHKREAPPKGADVPHTGTFTSMDVAVWFRVPLARCIETDDPGLKPK
jgi:hypothetical protein